MPTARFAAASGNHQLSGTVPSSVTPRVPAAALCAAESGWPTRCARLSAAPAGLDAGQPLVFDAAVPQKRHVTRTGGNEKRRGLVVGRQNHRASCHRMTKRRVEAQQGEPHRTQPFLPPVRAEQLDQRRRAHLRPAQRTPDERHAKLPPRRRRTDRAEAEMVDQIEADLGMQRPAEALCLSQPAQVMQRHSALPRAGSQAVAFNHTKCSRGLGTAAGASTSARNSGCASTQMSCSRERRVAQFQLKPSSDPRPGQNA